MSNGKLVDGEFKADGTLRIFTSADESVDVLLIEDDAITVKQPTTFTDDVIFSDKLIPPNVAANQTAPGIAVVIPVDVPAGTSGDVDVVLEKKMVVTDVVVVKTAANGGSGDTLTVKNGTNAITNAIDLNVNDQTVVRAGTINDAYHAIAAAGTLRCSRAQATNGACRVYVHGMLSA